MLSNTSKTTKTERQTKNLHKLDYIFFWFWWPNFKHTLQVCNQHHTAYFNLHLLTHNHVRCIYLNIHGSHWWIVQRDNSAIILHVQDYKLFWDNAQGNYKDQDLMAVTWNNIMKYVELAGLCQLYMHFLRICSRTRFICERSAEYKTMQFSLGFSWVSVYMWNGPYSCIFYLTST